MSRVLLDLSHAQTDDLESSVRAGHVFSDSGNMCCCGGLDASDFQQQSVPQSPGRVPRVLDCSDSVISALRCATNTASMLLSVGSVLVESV